MTNLFSYIQIPKKNSDPSREVNMHNLSGNFSRNPTCILLEKEPCKKSIFYNFKICNDNSIFLYSNTKKKCVLEF